MSYLKSLRGNFEKQLRNKLMQKTKLGVGEEGLLLKSFKFFDVMNKGIVTKENFKKTVEKIGVVIEAEDIDALFEAYDLDKDGYVNYTEFAGMVFGHEDTSVERKASAKEAQYQTTMPLIELMRKKMAARGARGILGLAKSFKIMDDNRSGKLDAEEFTKALREYKLGLDDSETKSIFQLFDSDRSGEIDYNEFLRAVRGEMNANRKELVVRAFERLDVNQNGVVESSDVKGMYNPARHPAVLEGRKTEDQVLQEFLETFETHHNLRHGQEKDYVVTKEEFIEYYNNISASIDGDEYFEVMINSSWNLSGKAATYASYPKGYSSPGKQDAVRKTNGESPDSPFRQKGKVDDVAPQRGHHGVAPKAAEDLHSIYKFNEESKKMPLGSDQGTYERHIAEISESRKPPEMAAKPKFGNIVATDLPKYQNIMLERFRTRLVQRGGKGVIGIERQFKIFDLDGSGYLDRDEFKQAVNDYKLEVDERDLDNLFKIFDKNMDARVDYKEFMSMIVGRMNEFRLNLAVKAFEGIDEDEDDVVDLEDVRRLYNAKSHPDVKSGKKSEEEAVADFISSFEAHHNNFAPDSADTRVSRVEFMDYYKKVSATIESDAYFDQMLTNAWKLGLKANTEKQPYAGVSAKIFQVDSKSQWNYDHHRTMFSFDHPMKSGEDVSEYGKSVKGKTIYEMSEAMKAAGKDSFGRPRKEPVEEKKVSATDVELLKKVRDKLQARGARGMVGIQRKFAIIDDDRSGVLEEPEFEKGMRELRMGLDAREIARVFRMFDINSDGTISYNEFLRILIGEMSGDRKAVVDAAFTKLDKTGDGVITVDDLKDVYRADRHPDVLAKKKTEGEVLSEFLDTFEQHYGILHPSAKDRIITRDEFREYYNNISASIDDDKYFELMMINAWNLSQVGPYPKAWASDY